MSENMGQSKLYCGMRFYVSGSYDLTSEKILELVTQLNSYASSKLSYYSFLKSSDARSTRSKKIDLSKFKADFKSIQFGSVSFYDRNIRQYSLDEYGMHLVIFTPFERVKFYVIELEFSDHRLACVLPDMMHNLLGLVSYGFVCAAPNSKELFMEVSLIPVSEFVPGQPLANGPRDRELGCFQKNEQFVGSKVFKAYWGNLLNKDHIAALGGKTRVKREAPVYSAKDLGDGLFLQLTESPTDCIEKKFAEKLLKLEKYLSPIKVNCQQV